MPRTLVEAAEREKDIRFSSRTRLSTDAALRMRKAKAALRPAERLPPELRRIPTSPSWREVATRKR